MTPPPLNPDSAYALDAAAPPVVNPPPAGAAPLRPASPAETREHERALDALPTEIDQLQHWVDESLASAELVPDVEEPHSEFDQPLAEAIFQQSHDAILVLDYDRCVSANQVACELIGASTDELHGDNFFKLLADQFGINNDDWVDSLRQQLATEGAVVCELRRDRPEGELWIEFSFRTFNTAGHLRVLMVGHDISRLRKFQTELSRSHDFLHHTINSVQHPLTVKSADLKYVLANQAFCELVNMPFDQIKGRSYGELVGGETDHTRMLDESMLESGQTSVNTEWIRRANGSVTTLSTHRSRFHDPVTGAAFVVTASRDVTAELATERRLRLLASVFENAHESVAVLTKDGKLHEANPEFIGTVGVQRDDLMGSSLELFVDWGQAKFDDVIGLANSGTPWFGHVKLLKGAQQPISCWLSLSPSQSPAGDITNLIAMFSDITQIEATRSELHRQALHDNLTQLPNRRFFRQQITDLIEGDVDRSVRFGVSFLDLDDFKIVNDTLGHDAGDRLLIEVSRRIRDRLGDDCFLARFGGDEFALLIPETHGHKSRAKEYSGRVVEALCEPFQLGEHEVHVGVSVGTTIYPDDAQDVESLMRQADVAMYQAKEEGKNKVRLFSRELVDVIERRQAMLSELRTAVDAQQLRVVYQPKLDLATNQVIGCEALLRWQRADGSHVSPADFIPLAEESGLINRLGDQMFHAVCQQAKVWHDAGLLHGPIAVNLTERQLKEPQMLDNFIAAIEQNGLQPQWLELEITENAIMADVERAVALMQRIRDCGIGIAIDDFGTGYSSLGHIKNFPVQSLKLDNLFVEGLPDDSDAVAVAKTVLSLAQGLNLQVTAEGVETKAQRDFLKSIGCDAIQGYLLSAPLEPDAFGQWLQSR